MLVVGGAAASVPDAKESGYKISDQLSSLTDAAQSAYTAALAEAADRYSKAMSAVSVQISGEPEPLQSAAFASVSSAYFGAIAVAHQAVQRARENIIPEATPTPTPGYFDWASQAQQLAQKHLEDSVKWASDQYEQAKAVIGPADATPTTPSANAHGPLELAKLNYYAGLGVAHDRYNEFLASVSAVASSWAGATPTPTANLAEKAGENWDWLVAQVSDKVYGAPTPTPAWYANYYSQATQVPSAVHSIVSELLVGKEPTYRESVLAQLAAAYSQATSTVGSVYSEATQAVDDVIEGAVEALGNAGKIAIEQISEMRDKAADTIGEGKAWIKDEL